MSARLSISRVAERLVPDAALAYLCRGNPCPRAMDTFNAPEDSLHMPSARRTTKLFVSHAHKDAPLYDEFMELLTDMLRPSRRYDFRLWTDRSLLVGESWHAEIAQAIVQCDAGLLLVSPAFLGSEYIAEHELPKFLVNPAKILLPVMLKKVNLQRHDLKGLEERQLFQFRTRGNTYKSFALCGSKQKSEFVYELHEHIEQRLDKLFSSAGHTP